MRIGLATLSSKQEGAITPTLCQTVPYPALDMLQAGGADRLEFDKLTTGESMAVAGNSDAVLPEDRLTPNSEGNASEPRCSAL